MFIFLLLCRFEAAAIWAQGSHFTLCQGSERIRASSVMSDSNVVRTTGLRFRLEEIARRTSVVRRAGTLTGSRTRPSWSGSHSRPSWSGSRTSTWSVERNPDEERRLGYGSHDEPLSRPSKTRKRVHVERGSALDAWCSGWSDEAWKEYGWSRVDGTCPTRWEYDSRYDRKRLDYTLQWGKWFQSLDGEDLPPWTPGLTRSSAIDAVNAIDAARQTGYFLGRPLDQYGTPVAREFGYKDDSCFIPSSEGPLAGQTGIPWSEGHMPWSEGQISGSSGPDPWDSPRLPTSNALFIFDKPSRHSRSRNVVPSLLSQCRWLG